MQLGDEAGSLEALERAIAVAPETTESQAMAVLLQLRKREFDAALVAARKFADDHPTLAMGQTLLGTVHAVSGRLADARDAFERALQIDAGDLDALNNLGHIYYEEQRWEKARDALKSVADKRGGDLGALLKLAVAESRLGREPEAMAWLEKAVAKYPADPAPRAALARVYLATGRAADAVDLVFDFSVNRELTMELRDLLGRAQLQRKQFQAAAKTLQVLAEQRPDDVQAHRNLARAYEGAGQIDAALRAINRAHDLEPGHKPTRFSRAKLLTLAGRYDEARGLVGDLKKEHPNSFELVDLEGAIALGSGDFAAAVAAYQRAFERRETNMQLLKLARALMGAGQVKEAESRLEVWLKAHPEDVLTRTVLANYLLNQQRTADAQAQFSKVVELNPNDALAKNNLAWLLLQSGKKGEALAQAQQAYALAPENPHVLDTLGEILLAHGGRGEQALPLLQQAAGALPDDRAVQVNLARALAQTGDVQKARAMLQKAIAGDQPFRNRSEAESLLKSLTLLGGSSG
jgi:putative PEP-CTERM system TPR-repeat lipoprotein